MHVITRKRLNEFAEKHPELHYNRNKIYIRHVLTHEEYDAGKWRN
jgi:mRNA-degrading endonuclease HigB of HigAB toxin-antitoxin module